MALLTKQLLTDLGIEIEPSSYDALVAHFEDTLDKRVIEEVVSYLTPEQSSQLADMQDAEGEKIYAWLTANVPELPEIISDEVDILLGELAESAEQV